VDGYRPLRHGRWAVVSLSVAVLSLPVLPRGLGYDPWSWLVWGRELAHGSLVTSGAASSIKPLPVMVTTLLAPAGSWAPDLWLVCARTGVVLALVLSYHLGRALAGRVAGVIAAVGLLTAYQVAYYLTLEGMSEPLCAMFVLAAFDAHLAGRRRRAVALGFLGALVRIEIWPFLALYGLFFIVRGAPRPRIAALGFAGVLVALPAVWLLPDLLSSGDLLRSASRAKFESQGGPLVTRDPGLATVKEGAGMMLAPLAVAFAAETVRDVVVWARRRAVRTSLPLAAAAWAWLLVEAVMGQLRIATGAPRYLLPGVALAAVVAGCAWADLARFVGRLAVARSERVRRRPWVGGVATMAVLVAASGYGVAQRVGAYQEGTASASEVQVLAREIPAAVRQLGGRARILACGGISASQLQNPAVAWVLHVHLGQVGINPGPRGVVFEWASLPAIPAEYRADYRIVGTVGTGHDRWTELTTCPTSG
jgi:hypothetical protein